MERRGAPALVGGLGSGATATVDDAGNIDAAASEVFMSWWVGANDEWRDPADDSARRQQLVGSAPIVETFVRVPSGEVVHRVYGIGGPAGVVVVEVENRSPTPVAIALAVRPSAIKRKGELALAGNVVTVGRRPTLVLPRAPLRFAVGDDLSGGARAAVFGGRASEGPFVASRSKRIVEAAFVFPVPHRTTLRAALVLRPDAAAPLDVGLLPGADEVQRGWTALLERAMRTELPAPAQEGVDAARAALLLAAAGDVPRSDLVVALEDWGFDAEAAAAWGRLGTRARRQAARRVPSPETAWARMSTYLAAASPAWAFPGGPAPMLAAVRELLVVDGGDHVELLPGFPAQWLGADVAVRDAPTRSGPVSFALRWHGARPALLWDAPAVTLTSPVLDPGWSCPGGAGEALLAEPEARLLSVGPEPDPDPAGAQLDEPDSFS